MYNYCCISFIHTYCLFHLVFKNHIDGLSVNTETCRLLVNKRHVVVLDGILTH